MSRLQRLADRKRDAAQAVRLLPAGSKFRCIRNGLLYQLGAKHGMSGYWMMQENPPQKGVVDARQILRDFERVQP